MANGLAVLTQYGILTDERMDGQTEDGRTKLLYAPRRIRRVLTRMQTCDKNDRPTNAIRPTSRALKVNKQTEDAHRHDNDIDRSLRQCHIVVRTLCVSFHHCFITPTSQTFVRISGAADKHCVPHFIMRWFRSGRLGRMATISEMK